MGFSAKMFMNYDDILFIKIEIGGGWIYYNSVEVILRDGTSFLDKNGGTRFMKKAARRHNYRIALNGLAFKPNGKYDFTDIDFWPSVIKSKNPRVLRMDSITTIWFTRDELNRSGFSVIHSSGDTGEKWYERYGEVTSNYEDIIKMINAQKTETGANML